MDDRDGLPWIPVPERLDRPLRLGPFPSGREAVKFVTAVAVGASVSLLVQPWAGLPIVAVAAVVAFWRPEGEGLDERFARVARWTIRQGLPRRTMTAASHTSPAVGRRTVVLPDGRAAAVLRTAGVPLAFLPPADLAHQFERYRELLRSLPTGLVVVATRVPIHADAVLPPALPAAREERAAWEGYRELVALLARRRSVRQVLLALAQETAGVEGLERLEGTVGLLRARLSDLGVRSERLVDRALSNSARRLGWAGTEVRP